MTGDRAHPPAGKGIQGEEEGAPLPPPLTPFEAGLAAGDSMARKLVTRYRRLIGQGATCASVVTVPVGPACTVLLEDGKIIHGYRVHADLLREDHTVVFRGVSVRAVVVNDLGTELTHPDGREVLEHVGDGKLRSALNTDRPHALRIRAVEPPPLVDPHQSIRRKT